MMRRLLPRRVGHPVTSPLASSKLDLRRRTQTLGLCGYASGRPHSWQKEGHCGYATGRPQGSSEFDLSLGKIVDTLRVDYPAMFERSPNFDIYDECIIFELDFGRTHENVRGLRGKRKYHRALITLQSLAMKTISNAKVECTVQLGSPYDYTLRVNWTCEGEISKIYGPLYMSAISLYSVSNEVSLGAADQLPLHRINRHKIEFVEIHPPLIRNLLPHFWWQPQHHMAEPALALQEHSLASFLQPHVGGARENFLGH